MIPVIVYFEDILKVLISGEYWLLSTAFVWSKTPQGHCHWERKITSYDTILSLDRTYLLLCLAERHRDRVEMTPAASALLHKIAVEDSWVE